MGGPSERAFETAICESLLSAGGYTTCKVGNAADREQLGGVEREVGRDLIITRRWLSSAES